MKSGISNHTNEDDMRRIYRRRFKGQLEYRSRVWKVLIRNYFQQWVRSEDVVLDLGAGYGEFINHIQCGTKYAMDLNPDTAQKVNADVTVLAQDCAEPWALSDNSTDVVFTSNFFEHLPDKQALTRALGEAKRCLKPGGRLIAMGPNIKYIPGPYWDFIDHHIPLTELSLAEAVTHQGFRIEKCIGKFLPFTMASGLHYPTLFVAMYLRLPLAWRIFGKQFLVIGKKGSV
jgi:SAM-dependent methyltransferase